MAFDSIMEAFEREAPVCCLVRMLLAAALPDEALDQHLEQAADGQYTRDLLFSALIDIMSLTVSGSRPSLHAAIRSCQERLPTSVQAVYSKLARTEPVVCRALLQFVVQRLEQVRQQLQAQVVPLLEGYQTLVVDGNHLAGTEHRLKVTRGTRAAPLPGQLLVVYEPDVNLIREVFPCEDAHAQERSIIPQLIATALPGQLYIADRNFCTTGNLLDLAGKSASFLIRRHGSSLCCRESGPAHPAGAQDGRPLSEQEVAVFEAASGRTLQVRQITIHRAQKNQKLEDVLLLSNLPKQVSAQRIAELYLERWSIERAFQQLTSSLGCEINTLCYPKAALLAFTIACVSFNLWSVCRCAIAQAHGQKQEQALSTYYFADEWQATNRGMAIILPDPAWAKYGKMKPDQVAKHLLRLAKRMHLPRYLKSPRGPKKPRGKRLSGKTNHHVSTARLLARENKPC